MTQPTNGPATTPAVKNPNQKKDVTASTASPASSSTHASKSPAPVQANGKDSSCSTSGTDASKRSTDGASKTDKSRAESWDAAGSRSPGSLPGQMVEKDKECCSTSGATSSEKDHSRHDGATLTPSASQGSAAGRAKSTQNTSSSSSKSSTDRPTQTPPSAPVASHSDSRSSAPSMSSQQKPKSPAPAEYKTARGDETSPQDPKRVETTDPVQPSWVAQTSVGATGGVSDGETTTD